MGSERHLFFATVELTVGHRWLLELRPQQPAICQHGRATFILYFNVLSNEQNEKKSTRYIMSSQSQIHESFFLLFIFFSVGDRGQSLPCTPQAPLYGWETPQPYCLHMVGRQTLDHRGDWRGTVWAVWAQKRPTKVWKQNMGVVSCKRQN